MSILSSHAASWHSDKWYRRAWFIWPQVASLLVVGWMFAGVPNPPWARTEPPQPTPREPAPRPDTDKVICSLDFRYSRDALLNACDRLIDKGAVWPYLMRARFYFWNGEHDRAIEDFSAFIHKYPNSDTGFNERGLSYAKKGEYDRAIVDYTEAIRLNRKPDGPYINRGSAFEKKGELDKALADFREALSHGSTTAPEDIKRIEGAIQSLPASGLSAVQLAGGHYEMPGYRWVSDDIQVGGKPYTRVGLVWAPVEQKSVTPVANPRHRSREVCCRWDQSRRPSITSLAITRNISVRLVSNLKASHGVTSNGSKKRLAARIAPHTRSLTHATGPSII